MTYGEFLRWCLSEDARETLPPLEVIAGLLNQLGRTGMDNTGGDGPQPSEPAGP